MVRTVSKRISISNYEHRLTTQRQAKTYKHELHQQSKVAAKGTFHHTSIMKVDNSTMMCLTLLLASSTLINACHGTPQGDSKNVSSPDGVGESCNEIPASTTNSSAVQSHDVGGAGYNNIASTHHPIQNQMESGLVKFYSCIRATPEEQHYRICHPSKLLTDHTITKEDIKTFYSYPKFIDAGGSNDVFSVTLNLECDNVKRGERIALMLSSSYFYTGLPAYAQVSLLKEQNICDFYPEIYQVYFGPANDLLTKIGTSRLNHYKRFVYIEMELMDPTSIYDKYENSKFPDSLVFEYFLGKWATDKIAKVTINDAKGKHFVTKYANYHRAYHIGPDIYLFPPGDMPKRIDLEIYGMLDDEGSNYPFFHIGNTDFKGLCRTTSGEATIKAVEKGGNIFEIFSQHFGKYKVRENDLLSVEKIKHFEIPEKYLH